MARRAILAAWAALAAALVAAGCATRGGAGRETWADFTMMGSQRGATLWSAGNPASHFQWSRASADEAHAQWTDPTRNNAPTSNERFLRVGDWVMLDGWWGNGTYYTQRIERDEWCDAACGNCTTIATEGPQHYARWQVPATDYCLRTEGRIVEQSSGKSFRFRHVQVWSAPRPCANGSQREERCIIQHETWWDDNQTPFERKLERSIYIAKGLGLGFRIEQSFPKPWQAEQRAEPAR